MTKTANYPNFYESIDEAWRRLRDTVVLYDGAPYLIVAITNHMPDGIYRVYMEPCQDSSFDYYVRSNGMAYPVYEFPYNYPALGDLMDKWMESNPSSPIIRKKINSPKFNKFRPFPLGMINYHNGVYYIERRPLRKGEQGLLGSAILGQKVTLTPPAPSRYGSRFEPEFRTNSFRDCVMGKHPTPEETLEALNDPTVVNEGAAFHREFALIRGPFNSLYLAHKCDVVGMLPRSDFSSVLLGREFAHLKETVEELGIFSSVAIK